MPPEKRGFQPFEQRKITAFLTCTKTVPRLAGGINGKRWRLFLMERATRLVAISDLF